MADKIAKRETGGPSGAILERGSPPCSVARRPPPTDWWMLWNPFVKECNLSKGQCSLY